MLITARWGADEVTHGAQRTLNVLEFEIARGGGGGAALASGPIPDAARFEAAGDRSARCEEPRASHDLTSASGKARPYDCLEPQQQAYIGVSDRRISRRRQTPTPAYLTQRTAALGPQGVEVPRRRAATSAADSPKVLALFPRSYRLPWA